jgi:hypothetical protein
MADIQKKGFLLFLERLKLLDCCCVRSHRGIPCNYRIGIGGILNVSFGSSCLFCKKILKNIELMEKSLSLSLSFFLFLSLRERKKERERETTDNQN